LLAAYQFRLDFFTRIVLFVFLFALGLSSFCGLVSFADSDLCVFFIFVDLVLIYFADLL